MARRVRASWRETVASCSPSARPVQHRPILADELLPGPLVAGGAPARQREILDVECVQVMVRLKADTTNGTGSGGSLDAGFDLFADLGELRAQAVRVAGAVT